MGVIDRKKFDKLADKLDKFGRYHINRSIGIDKNNHLEYTSWYIFDRLDDGPKYFSPENKPVLSSVRGDTLEDIKYLIKKEKKEKKK